MGKLISKKWRKRLKKIAKVAAAAAAVYLTAGAAMKGIAAMKAGAVGAAGAGAAGAGAAAGGAGMLGKVVAGAKSLGGMLAGAAGGGSALLGTGLQLAGGLMQNKAAGDAAETQAASTVEAARIAADAAKFRPVGVSTKFGQSKFGFDAQGNLNEAGYNLSPEMKAQQDRMMGVSNQALGQYEGSFARTAPMGQAADRMMGLGNQYLAASPQEQAQKFFNDQQLIYQAGDASDQADMFARLQAQGRGGLQIGGSDGMMASNPEMAARQNMLEQRRRGDAAAATQGGMDYARFGAGMVGGGGDMLQGMYRTQSGAYDPYRTALGGATQIEGLGQNAMDLGMNLGSTATAANARSGMLLGQGMQDAAGLQAGADARSPWGTMLGTAGQAFMPQQQPQQQQRFNPYTGAPL